MVKKATKKPTKKKAETAVEPDKDQKANTASRTQAGRVFDITAPGKSMPSSNGRPTIITHRSVVQDPMMSTTTASSGDTGEPITVSRPKRIRIEPLHADDVQDDGKTDDTSDAEATLHALQASVGDVDDQPVEKTVNLDVDPPEKEPVLEASQTEEAEETPEAPETIEVESMPVEVTVAEDKESADTKPEHPTLSKKNVSEETTKEPEVAPEPEPTPEPEPEHASSPTPTVLSNDEPDEVDAMAAQAVAKKGKKHEEAKAAEALVAAKKLAESKQYNVPISIPHGGHVAHAILGVFVALLVIAVVGGILAIDAEIIDVNIDLPFDLL